MKKIVGLPASAATMVPVSSTAADRTAPFRTSRLPPKSAAVGELSQRPGPLRSSSDPGRKNRSPITAEPGVDRQRDRDVSANSWRDRAGPWFDLREYTSSKMDEYGTDFRARPDHYQSDSEASDTEDVPTQGPGIADPRERARRFLSETLAAFERQDAALGPYRRATFKQDDLPSPNHNGVCLGLSLDWLRSVHDEPSKSIEQRLADFDPQNAARIRRVQDQSNRLHDELPFRNYHPLKELSEKSEDVRGIQFSKYSTHRAGKGSTLADVAGHMALRLQRPNAPTSHLLIPSPGAHAITCEKLGDRFRIFEPNHGVYEADSKQLDELLAGVLMKHFSLVKSLEDRMFKEDTPITKFVERAEVRIIPVRFKTDDLQDPDLAKPSKPPEPE
ncbi:MAG TPA: YopT-type cysteine protease domain-containing protein [Methylibium sp.]|uniref:YopT-type cysteine protease domain-containing protein n=1 Tax=Methylibium sp. TaxID=2067992 RepID=UPI002DB9E2C2|nr:YopT-type cysteine protease domain-containing protein [Methylibium sp.]HEU4457606.1 YopT-type cysteine protease domain-containing protein [Methylibium sp.]